MFHRTTSTTYSYDHIFTSEPPIQTASRTPPTTGRGVLELQSFSVSNTLKHNCVHGGSGGERMIDLIFNFIFRFLVKLRKIQIDMEGLIFSLPPLIVGKIMSLFLFFVRIFLLCWNNRSSSGPHVICDHNHYSKPTANVLFASRFSSRFFSDKDESGINKFISVISKPSPSKFEIIYCMYRRLGSVLNSEYLLQLRSWNSLRYGRGLSKIA